MREAETKDVQSPSNCRWARLAQQLPLIPEQEQSDGLWVCVRPRRGRLTADCAPPYVTEEECAGCEFWESAAMVRQGRVTKEWSLGRNVRDTGRFPTTRK